MRDEPVEAEIDAENAEHIHADDQNNDPGPAEKPGQQRQRCKGVAKNESEQIVSLEFHQPLSATRLWSAMIEHAGDPSDISMSDGRTIAGVGRTYSPIRRLSQNLVFGYQD